MKVWNYVYIIIGITLIFEICGIPVASDLLQNVGISVDDGFNLRTAVIYLAVFGGSGILIGLAAGITIGLFTQASPENFIILGFITGSLTLFFSSFYGIVNAARAFDNWIYWIVLFIIAPLGVGYLIALVEFFRGTD